MLSSKQALTDTYVTIFRVVFIIELFITLFIIHNNYVDFVNFSHNHFDNRI